MSFIGKCIHALARLKIRIDKDKCGSKCNCQDFVMFKVPDQWRARKEATCWLLTNLPKLKLKLKTERDEKSRVLIELKTLVRVIAAQSYSGSTGSRNTVEANPHDGLPCDHDWVPQQSLPECRLVDESLDRYYLHTYSNHIRCFSIVPRLSHHMLSSSFRVPNSTLNFI